MRKLRLLRKSERHLFGKMEKLKTFEDLVKEMGGTITPYDPGEEFYREFCAYMEESIRQSRINHAKALESARDIIIF